jgi:ATP-binding protein involved in chromosome partitioning
MTKETIIKALEHVRYPGNGKNIVEADMLLNDIELSEKSVRFSIRFPRQNDPFRKSVLKAAEQAVHTYIAENVEVVINTIAPQPQASEQVPVLPNVKNIIAVFSGKGGVGKSTVSANLAVALANQGYNVGLLDADIHGPSLPKMFGVENQDILVTEENGKQKMLPLEKFGVKMLSIGFFVDADTALVWRGTIAGNALKQLITDSNWGALDFFIIDFPPGTSDIQLTLVQNLNITSAIVVSTPQEVALADARKGINMFQNEKINIPVLGLVENMAWFTPAELPENKYFIFGKDGGKNLAEKLGVPFLAQIPLVQSIRESGDGGEPIAYNENSLTAKYFDDLAAKVAEKVGL